MGSKAIKAKTNPDWKEELEEILPPPKPGAKFRCRDCGNVWYGTHEVMLLDRFYEMNKACPNCSKSNIEMAFVIFTIQH